MIGHVAFCVLVV